MATRRVPTLASWRNFVGPFMFGTSSPPRPTQRSGIAMSRAAEASARAMADDQDDVVERPVGVIPHERHGDERGEE